MADWLTSPDNPYFSRAIANRIWANYFSVGLVEPVDDMRLSNPASNEKLLSAAAAYLVEHRFDVKALMRAILQSETYQRTSLPTPGNEQESRFYSRYYPRRLMAEVMLDAIAQVIDVPTEFTKVTQFDNSLNETKDYPIGTRALQLRDSAVDSYFLKTFGRNDRNVTCECERSNAPSVVQTLHVLNGTTVNQRLMAKDGRCTKLATADLPDDKVVEAIYLAALSRFPTAAEIEGVSAIMAEAGKDQRRAVIEDLLAAIFTSKEFKFNH